MPTILNGITIPDYPEIGQEICHLFTGNYLYRLHGQHAGEPYKDVQTDSIEFLKNMIHLSRVSNIPIGNIIMQGDLIIIGNGRNNLGEIVNITHSMIAISPTTWFGCNNIGTFGNFFNALNIPANSLYGRREVDINSVAAGILNLATFTFGNFVFDVLR